jgi:transcriptional regulator with XRE-family HTH domain
MSKNQSVGTRLRALRAERNLSQRALADLAGISPNSVSLIEREEISPSVATLQNLATALHVRVSYFFETETEERVLHSKAKDRPCVDSRGVCIQSIGARIHEQEVEPFRVHLSPRTSSGERQVIHAGHEVVYCIKGKFEYLIDGTIYQLEPGDFLLFEADQPHLWRNPYDSDAEFILILQTPGATLEPVKRHFVEYPSITHIDDDNQNK